MILYPNAHFKNVREIELGFLKENNIIFIGASKSGHWEIKK